MIISLIPQDTTSGSPIMREGTIDFPHGERRMTRTKLVTGGVHIADRGQTVKDRVANITLNLIELADEQRLEYWHVNRTLLWFSDNSGVYSCRINSLNMSQGVAIIQAWIISLIVSVENT